MTKALCFEKDGREAGSVELPKSIFAREVNEYAVHDVVLGYLANQRQGDASTKGRSEIRGGGRKPFKQKGTGRARQGTIRSPLMRGGGVVFGPLPRDYRKRMPKKVRRLALRSALSSRAADNAVIVLRGLEMSTPKTKAFAELLKTINAGTGKTLVVLDKSDVNTIKSARNVSNVRITMADMITTYDVLWAEKIVVTSAAVKIMEEVFAS